MAHAEERYRPLYIPTENKQDVSVPALVAWTYFALGSV
jgi:hypothetical protein